MTDSLRVFKRYSSKLDDLITVFPQRYSYKKNNKLKGNTTKSTDRFTNGCRRY